MLNINSTPTARAVFGAALIALAGACSDVPSGPLPDRSELPKVDRPILTPSDVPFVDALPSLQAGETVQRRVLRGVKGDVLRVESVVGVDGRPRVTLLRRDDGAVLRVDNTWPAVGGWTSAMPRISVRGSDGLVRVVDSRSVSAVALAAASEKLRTEAQQLATPPASGRVRRLEEDNAACDAEVKAANIATWQYVAAASAVIAAAASGNVFLAASAYTIFLAADANYEAKQVDLDKCIAAIGKKPTMDEF